MTNAVARSWAFLDRLLSPRVSGTPMFGGFAVDLEGVAVDRRGVVFPEVPGDTGPHGQDGPSSVRCPGCRCELDETCRPVGDAR